MSKSLRRFSLIVCMATSFLTSARAQDQEFGQPSPDELKMTSIAEQPGAPAVVLSHEEICDDNYHYCSMYKRIKILTEAGISKYSDVSLYSYRGYSVAEVRARTIHSDGSIVNFEGKPLDKVVYKGRDQRLNVKSFSVPDVRVGSMIEYRYLYRYPDKYFMSPPRWVLQDELFQKHVYFKYIPSDHAFGGSTSYLVDEHGVIDGIGWSGRLPPGLNPKLTELPKIFVELETSNVAPFIKEDHTLPDAQLQWNLQIYYRNQGGSPEKWWKDEGKSWNKAVDKFVGKSDGLNDVIAKNTSPSDTPEQKVKKLYAFVTTLDNYTYMPQRTHQEQKVLGLDPNRGAADVLRQGGDRDDITRLFVALVRKAGIPAYAMRVSDRSERIFDKGYLSTMQFDAEIAIVTLDGKDVFLDPGSKYAPYGLLNWRYSSSGGIRQTAKGTDFAESPVPSYTHAITKRVVRVVLKEDGSAEGTMAVMWAGQEALLRREDASRTDDAGRKKLLEDEVRSWLPGNAQVNQTKAPDWDVIESPLIANFTVSTPLAVSAGHRWTIPVDMLEVNETPMFPHAERVNHVYLDYPYRQIDDVVVVVPASLAVETLPQSEDVKLPYALCHTERSQEGQRIVSKRDLAIAEMAIPVSEYKTLKGFFDKVKSVDEEQAVLRGANSAKAN